MLNRVIHTLKKWGLATVVQSENSSIQGINRYQADQNVLQLVNAIYPLDSNLSAG